MSGGGSWIRISLLAKTEQEIAILKIKKPYDKFCQIDP